MQLSVVIPCYNGAATIGEQLEALACQKWDGEWEVVVSDNGSTDGSQDIVESFRDRLPNLQVLNSSSDRGRSRNRNAGIAQARGDLILTCDADDVVADNYVAAMAGALAAHDFVACRLEAERLNEPWQTESWPCGQCTGLLDFAPTFLPFGGAGTLGFKRVVFDTVGGFDPKFRSREDSDFCWKAQLAGFALHFVAETVIHYRYPKGYSQMYRQSRELAWSSVQLYKKYRSLGMPRLPRREALRGHVRWKRILAQLKHFKEYDRARRAHFVRDVGHKLGRLEGSIRYRVLAL